MDSVHREYYINDAGRQMDILAVEHLAALPGALRRDVPFPGQWLQGRVHPRDRGRPAAEVDHDGSRPEGEVFGNLPPDEPEGGDKDAYIDAVITRAREL